MIPLWDVLHLLGQCLDQGKAWLRARFKKQENTVQAYEQDSIPKLLRSFRSEYFSRTPRITSPLNRGYFQIRCHHWCGSVRTLLEAIGRRSS